MLTLELCSKGIILNDNNKNGNKGKEFPKEG